MVYRTIILFCVVAVTWEINFDKTIVAVHFPHYKITLSLGTCKNRTLFSQQQVWAPVKFNRILDIYYASNDSSVVSRVEINLIINNTEISAIANNDVGSTEFSAEIIFPVHIGVTFYSLGIFSCTPALGRYTAQDLADELYSVEEETDEEDLAKMPFYIKKTPTIEP